MKKTLLLAALSAMSLGAVAQSITPQMLEKFKSENTMTATDRAIHNAMAANDVRNLAVNQANQTEMDTYFTREAEQARLAAEAEAQKAEVIEMHEVPFQADAMNPPEQPKQWVSFKALLTVDQAKELKRFFDDRCIEFEAI